ncbi:MAG: hypothetical protein KDE27_15735 [Planctomycetes bacterium]|nr:hypothetical protein [Planctomycetota bacterium]
MESHAADPVDQTPAQWAVRWHGVAVAALLAASVPLFHLLWHGALGRDRPPIITRSQTEVPELTFDSFTDGTWATAMERHLREASPIVWRLRGTWNELLFRFGIVQNAGVVLGKDSWLFKAETLRPGMFRFEREAPERRRFLAALRDRVRAAGAELVVSLVPDKARVYPELAYEDGRLAPAKAPIYGAMLTELHELDIPVADVASAILLAKAAAPDQLFYYQRDTHWRPEGALAGGQAIAAVIESLPVGRALAPRLTAELGARTITKAVGDLAGMLGLLTRELPLEGGRLRAQPVSIFTADLAMDREFYGVVLKDRARLVPPLPEDPATEVLLIGTSFAEANGAGALALALGRPVRAVIGFGASGFNGLHDLRDELREGTRAKVVVWEIVERGLFEARWDTVMF